MALQNGSAVQFRPLNAFIAYRSFYNRMLPNMHQKERSGVLTTLWNADPYKNEWTLIAKVFSFLRAELGKDAVSLPSFLEHACSVLRIPTLDAYLEQQGFSLLEKENGKLVLVKDEGEDLEAQAATTTMETTQTRTARSGRHIGQVASNIGSANAASHHPSATFQGFKERNKENVSVAAGVFAEMKAAETQENVTGIYGDGKTGVFGDEEAAAGLYAEHELLRAVFDRGLVLNEPSSSSEASASTTTSSAPTTEIPDAAGPNSHERKKHLIQKLYSKAYEVLIGGEYPVVIGAKGGFSHTIKHNPIAAAAQIFARDKPFDFDVLVVDGTDEVKNHVFCKVQPPVAPNNGHKNNDSDQRSNKSNNTDSAFVLEPTGLRTTAVHSMAGPFSMAPENQKQWQKRQRRFSKKEPAHDSDKSTSLYTQQMPYQTAHGVGKFFIFNKQETKPTSRIQSPTEAAGGTDGTRSHASSTEDLILPAAKDSPLPTSNSVRFVNRSSNDPLPMKRVPVVLKMPTPSESPESIDSIDSIDSVDSVDTIDTIANSDHDKELTMATTPINCDIMQGQVLDSPPIQGDSDPYLWSGGIDGNGLAFSSSLNFSCGLDYGLGGGVGNGSLGPGPSANFAPVGGYGQNAGFGANHGCDTTAMSNNNCFVAPNAAYAQDNACFSDISPTPTKSVLGKRLHDDSDFHDSDFHDSDFHDSDTVRSGPTASPIKRNRLEDDMHYLVHTLHQDPAALTAQLASRQRPPIFDEIYRSQHLQAAMAAACGDTTAGLHPAVATTMPLSTNPGPDSVAAVAAYFGPQPTSANMALDLAQPQALDPMLGMTTMDGLNGMAGMAVPGFGMDGLDNMGLNMGMGAPQDRPVCYPTPTVPEVPLAYMGWATSNLN